MQPPTLAPEGRVPAHKCFDCRPDPSSPGLDILVRNSQHILTQQISCYLSSGKLYVNSVLHRGRFAAITRTLFVLSTCPSTLAHLFGSASAGEPGLCPARIPLPDESGSPLREILWMCPQEGLRDKEPADSGASNIRSIRMLRRANLCNTAHLSLWW
jgi:hypothetical protein